MKYKLIIWLCLTQLSTLKAAQPFDLTFYNINSLFGLSMREAAAVCKDANGFIWVSTKTGILRLTGADYRIYQLPIENANYISLRLAYSDNKLIAYTESGYVFRFNPIQDQFEKLFYFEDFFPDQVFWVGNLYFDSCGDIWCTTSIGLYRYKNNQLSLICSQEFTRSAASYDDDHLIFATETSLLMLNIRTLKSQVLTNKVPAKIPRMLLDRKLQKLWLGTSDCGLYAFDFLQKRIEKCPIPDFPTNHILDMAIVNDSTLWIAIDGQGVWVLNREATQLLQIIKEDINNPHSLNGDGVYALLNDNDRRIWVCTYSGGVSFANLSYQSVTILAHRPGELNSPHSNQINGVLQDHLGNLWLATNKGLSKRDTDGHWSHFYVDKQSYVFHSLACDKRGRIWAGTHAAGIFVLDAGSGHELMRFSPENSPDVLANNSYVFDIICDQQGTMWCCGINTGLLRYNESEKRLERLAYPPAYCMTELSDNSLVLGCTYGLSSFDKQRQKMSILKRGFLVHDILLQDSIAWMCTNGGGLISYDFKTDMTQKYTMQDGLSSNFVNSILAINHYLWLGTESGLCRFNPQTKYVQTFSPLFSDITMSFNVNSCTKLRNGQVAYGSNSGVLILEPYALEQNKPQGKIFLQDISVSGQSVRQLPTFKLNVPLDSLNGITLRYNQSSVSLDLTPVGDLSHSTTLSWWLDGLDEQWTRATRQHIISYSRLPIGTYQLHIRLYDGGLIDSRTFSIVITPPFWATWWFRLLTLLVFIALLTFLLRYYLNQMKQRHAEDKIRFFTRIAHELRTSLTLIKAPIEELNKESGLSQKGERYLHLATIQVSKLSQVATQLLDFQKADAGKAQPQFVNTEMVSFVRQRVMMFDSLAQSLRIHLAYHTPLDQYNTAIDEAMIEKTIDNLISNAIKYSPDNSRVEIHLNGNDSEWVLSVTDNGIGISKGAQRKLFREFYRSDNAVNSQTVGSGIGLLIVKNYVELHNGSIRVESEEKTGSTFYIKIPHKSVHSVEKSLQDITSLKPNRVEPIQTELSQSIMSVLIVEDNEYLRQFMADALREQFEISTSEDGLSAWNVIVNRHPDLIVSDVMMPQMDGFELCRKLKSTYETAHIPLILLTALSEKTDYLHGIGLGADDYLTKPFDISMLNARIKNIIHNRRILGERLVSKAHDVPTIQNPLNKSFVERAITIMHDNFADETFDRELFAAKMNVSSSLLYKKMKSILDVSPAEMIRNYRMRYAAELLKAGQYTIAEISEMCGYSSPEYFSTVFKKYYGKSPSDY